jgi:hypothetical protein
LPTKILVFNPLAQDDVERIEHELDRLLLRGWKIISSSGGNQASRSSEQNSLRHPLDFTEASLLSKDYLVLILHQPLEKVAGTSLQADQRQQQVALSKSNGDSDTQYPLEESSQEPD